MVVLLKAAKMDWFILRKLYFGHNFEVWGFRYNCWWTQKQVTRCRVAAVDPDPSSQPHLSHQTEGGSNIMAKKKLHRS